MRSCVRTRVQLLARGSTFDAGPRRGHSWAIQSNHAVAAESRSYFNIVHRGSPYLSSYFSLVPTSCYPPVSHSFSLSLSFETFSRLSIQDPLICLLSIDLVNDRIFRAGPRDARSFDPRDYFPTNEAIGKETFRNDGDSCATVMSARKYSREAAGRTRKKRRWPWRRPPRDIA